MKKVKPLLKADRAEEKVEVTNTIYSALRVGTDDLQTKYNDNIKVGNKYAIDEEQIGLLSIDTAFQLAKEGDETMLIDIEALKNTKGELVINGLKGRKLYNQLSDALEKKKEDDVAEESALNKKKQVDTTNTLYSMGISGDINTAQTTADESQRNKTITRQQHASLSKTFANLRAVNTSQFIKESDVETYSSLRAKAQLGTATVEEINESVNKLSYVDYKTIVNLSLSKGGSEGKGDKHSSMIDTMIKGVVKTNIGLNLEDIITSDLGGYNLGVRRKEYLTTEFAMWRSEIVLRTGKEPTVQEVRDATTSILKSVDSAVGKINPAEQADTSLTLTNINKIVEDKGITSLSDAQFKVLEESIK